jgi:hypothetical protein
LGQVMRRRNVTPMATSFGADGSGSDKHPNSSEQSNCPAQFRSASSSNGMRLLDQSRPSVHDVDSVIEGESVSRE